MSTSRHEDKLVGYDFGNEDTLLWAIKNLENEVMVIGYSMESVKFWDQKYYLLLWSFKSHTAGVLCLSSNKEYFIFSGVDCKTIMYRIINKENQQWADVGYRYSSNKKVKKLKVHSLEFIGETILLFDQRLNFVIAHLKLIFCIYVHRSL
ncbi:hypothetical protein PNEG_00566 [Pneumocystis murina B123]|uniref:Uncharacterized protein n=1 Tax=Pneumocystis murina (strain B123) TaxID=1069680 RepID=M7NUI0_PNEMU|nr:hypothetical protein PNEG_00566 [Pneumocystis murina B123]EMR10962.2 hypothetical protein PNEG_00566 [Pneumocystis murina B123]